MHNQHALEGDQDLNNDNEQEEEEEGGESEELPAPATTIIKPPATPKCPSEKQLEKK